MGKTGKGKVTKDEREAKELKEQKERIEEEQRVAGRVRDVLEEEGYAIQPYLSFSEHGVSPMARLVKNPNAKKDEQGTDSEETGGDKVEEGTA